MSTNTPAAEVAVYPDRDGNPMADNTLQWDWMVKIVGELRELFAGRQVFVAGDLLWYPVQGEPKTRQEWEEEGFKPQVVFLVRSPHLSTTAAREQTTEAIRFCERHSVQELYFVEPLLNRVTALVCVDEHLQVVYPLEDYISPRLGVGFAENFALGVFDWKPDIMVTLGG